jgi:DNA-directed DNA polymerase III PolC
VEPVGLLKMDFLGLKTLTVEKDCVELLGARNPRVPEELWDENGMLDPDKIPDDDKETYELFGRGETTGLFQFESDGMKKHLRSLQPERLTDLVAMNALYRPGPMAYIPDFIERKQGRKEVSYDHPEMEPRLKDTYGITVYQEQVMLLSRDLAGFTRGQSDQLRKAMGKKLMNVMAELKELFVKGCLENPKFRIGEWADEKNARNLIEKIWKDWEAFASYAFNKSHSVCYAWIAYQTGYLKAHYPAEFMCAQISSEIGNFDKLPGFVAEAQEMGLELKLPDVNESGAKFVPTSNFKGIRYGLSGIKGVGAAGEIIEAERKKGGPYSGFLDFCVRLAGTAACNKRVLENLTRTGAFSSFEPNRAKLFYNIEYALKKAQQVAKERASAQTSFFDLMAGGEEKLSDAELADSAPFTPTEDLKNERDFLGVYVSGHPIQACRRLISQASTFRSATMASTEEVDEMLKSAPVDSWKKKSNPHLKDERGLKHLDVRMVGILTGCQIKMPRARPDGTPGQKWAILQLDDGTGVVDAFCFAKAWEKYGAKIENAVDRLVMLSGEISYRVSYGDDDRIEKKNPTVGALNFTVREAYLAEDALPMISKALRIRIGRDDPQLIETMRAVGEAAARSPGSLPTVVELKYADGKVVEIDMGESMRIAPTVAFLSELAKTVKQSDTSFSPEGKIYLEPPRPKPWES